MEFDDPFDLILSNLMNQWIELSEGKYQLSESGANSLQIFLSKGLTEEEIFEAMQIATNKITNHERIEERFRYFCAICWIKIRGSFHMQNNEKIEKRKE